MARAPRDHQGGLQEREIEVRSDFVHPIAWSQIAPDPDGVLRVTTRGPELAAVRDALAQAIRQHGRVVGCSAGPSRPRCSCSSLRRW